MVSQTHHVNCGRLELIAYQSRKPSYSSVETGEHTWYPTIIPASLFPSLSFNEQLSRLHAEAEYPTNN